MNCLEMRSTFESTSAAGAMRISEGIGADPVELGLMFPVIGTSSAYAPPPDPAWPSWHAARRTTAGAPIHEAEPADAAIVELRRLSGLNWAQLARLFSVSRRSLHFWASGKPMTPHHEEHLKRLLATIRKIDRGSAGVNRTMLLHVLDDGTLVFDLLAEHRYDHVLALLGPGAGRRSSAPRLSEEARKARAPQAVEDLVGAFQDRIHREKGTGRAAKSVRVRGGR